MKTLLILRHAKSSWRDDTLPDYQRPLKARGRRDAPKMGQLLRKKDLLPQHILSSSAKRARQTTELFIEGSAYEGDVTFTRALYAAGPEAYLEALQPLDDTLERVMVVGHNPGLEMLLETLTDEMEALPTAAVAHVHLPIESWSALDEGVEGDLVDLWVPRQVA